MIRARTLIALLTVAAVVVAGVVVIAVATRGSSFTEPTPSKEASPRGLSSFYHQQLSWSGCGSGAQCTWVEVPVDYDEPTGATTRLRVKVVPSTGGDAKRSILVNPGGPGGSAVDFAGSMAARFGSAVRRTYDVVGVDPRGVGESSPLRCLSDKQFDAFTEVDPDPDDAAEIRDLRDATRRLGQACLDRSGPLAAHVSTVEAAKDMDVVRALLGRSRLDWFGASYGTELGAVYAQLFPTKVGRMVLDGAVDPSLDAVDSSLGQTKGFQRAIEAYAKDCVTQASCPLGTNVKAGLAKVAALLQQLDQRPLKGLGDRQLTESQAFYGIAVTLYDKQTWGVLTQALTAAFQGNGSVLLRLSDAYFERSPDGSYSGNLGQVIYAVNCLDSTDRLTVKQTEAIVPRFEKASPVFGRSLAWGALACTDWPAKATNPVPTIEAKGAPPILVLGTTRDPATPYEWAKSLASQLSSGVLVSREGDGHTAYASGDACITSAVDDFYVTGTVPKDGLFCQ